MQINTKTVHKDWGSELWIANNKEHDYCGKILTINPGFSTSLHFHVNKHETFYVLEGELEVVTVDTDTTQKSCHFLSEGDVFEINPHIPHRLRATGQRVKFIEISTFHEDTDSYRIIK
jgi:mannose-6-phosphate isomerase-like protein (cupin superfamily)|tara:strand:- start:266 stop:619 length:354 start_codon:yes stop_codon:yes gene_type:complete